jgi:hypothetical protein
MAVRKRNAALDKPAPKAKGVRPSGPKSPADRPRAPEPFEECGPVGGYGGAGADDDAKNKE